MIWKEASWNKIEIEKRRVDCQERSQDWRTYRAYCAIKYGQCDTTWTASARLNWRSVYRTIKHNNVSEKRNTWDGTRLLVEGSNKKQVHEGLWVGGASNMLCGSAESVFVCFVPEGHETIVVMSQTYQRQGPKGLCPAYDIYPVMSCHDVIWCGLMMRTA